MTRCPAIVLARTLTGLATVRSLGRAGVPVHVIYFEATDPVRLSRYARSATFFDESGQGRHALLDCIEQLARRVGRFPPLLPTSDRDALLLAEHQDRLRAVVRLWATPSQVLQGIVSKDLLYRYARTRGLPLIPDCAGPAREDYARWADEHPGPYIVKPIPAAEHAPVFRRKNYILPDSRALLAVVDAHGPLNIVAQRVVAGGDGYIFDTYGLTAVDGGLLTIASHRRWRQNAPDYGATTFGEIPALGIQGLEARLFGYTERLLDGLMFHGIFGIEWLMDRVTGELFLVDFNARPFLSIGHLTDSGMNLPFLAYTDLTGELPPLERTPTLRHLWWVDLLRDLEARAAQTPAARLPTLAYLSQLMRCRSFGYWSVGDLRPAIARGLQLMGRILAKLSLRHRRRSDACSA